MTGSYDAESKERTQALHNELRSVVSKHFTNRMAEDEVMMVLGAIAGLAGFYLAPFEIGQVGSFNASVLQYYLDVKSRGICTRTLTDVN